MQIIYKNVGETPLEALEKYRNENNLSAQEKLSYIGRLDPMAEGDLMIISGDENFRRDDFLGLDKTYQVSVLLGFETDTGDLLGIVQGVLKEFELNKNQIKNSILELRNLKEQKYPWFSSKNVNGMSLFDIFKSGKGDKIDRPSRKIKIHEIRSVEFSQINSIKLLQYIHENIKKVNGDFRQDKILEKWNSVLSGENLIFILVDFEIKVSTGTYIRGLCEEIKNKTKIPAVLFKLKRTKIHI